MISGLPGEQDQPRLDRRLQELLPRRPPEGRLEAHDRAQEDLRDHVMIKIKNMIIDPCE